MHLALFLSNFLPKRIQQKKTSQKIGKAMDSCTPTTLNIASIPNSTPMSTTITARYCAFKDFLIAPYYLTMTGWVQTAAYHPYQCSDNSCNSAQSLMVADGRAINGDCLKSSHRSWHRPGCVHLSTAQRRASDLSRVNHCATQRLLVMVKVPVQRRIPHA